MIFAFFGFNESFNGPAGLPQFKQDLDHFLKYTLAKNYSGKGSPRIVLFSPFANEKLPDLNYPDVAANNANIKLYADAMARSRQRQHVLFVDLFDPSQELYADAATGSIADHQRPSIFPKMPTSCWRRLFSSPIFDQTAPTGDFEKLRTTINDKNWEWHARYRTIDGYNVYGGRSHMEYESPKDGPKISNNQVMQEEMTQRDVMTANRDCSVWAVAQGKDLAV